LIKSPNHLELETEGPGLLVLSEIVYPGWVARVDGVEQPILSVGGLLRGLDLAAGDHRIEMDYKPVSLMLGAGISTITLLIIGMLWFVLGRGINENPE